VLESEYPKISDGLGRKQSIKTTFEANIKQHMNKKKKKKNKKLCSVSKRQNLERPKIA
jgi:hypothetical protein